MSDHTVQQVKALIAADLSIVEKAQLIEWLGSNLRQALLTDTTTQPQEPPAAEFEMEPHNGLNGFASTDESTPQREIPWEEQPWTEQELRELMRPNPKTGAEIVQLLERLDLSEWTAMDIPDVVEWINEQRRQETERRIQRWAELS